MRHDLTGLKIRTLRKEAGLTQGELAHRAGISPSYLNLIELNKRGAAGRLLDRIAEGLGVERALLDGEAERRVIATLEEIGADPALAAANAPPPTVPEALVGRHPDWADLLVRLYRAYLDRGEAVTALADRLNRDPFLGDSVHRLLTGVTSIRAAAEILDAPDSLADADRARFMRIVTADSRKLSDTARALAAFFDSAQTRIRSATPMEHVDAFIAAAGNHFPRLEELADSARGEVERLLRSDEAGNDKAGDSRHSRRFRRVREWIGRTQASAIEAVMVDPELDSEEARALAAPAIEAHLAAAIFMPYAPFLDAAERLRYDLDRLTRLFDVSYEQVAHRLATLRRPGAEGVRFAFMRADASGYVTKRLPLPGLPLPRYGHACPLWPVYGAFQTPGATQRAFGALPGGETFLFFARALEKSPAPAGPPRHLLSVMLACSAADAGRVVYGDGIDREAATVAVGTTCRLCARHACIQRQEPALIAYDEKTMSAAGKAG